MVVRTGVLLILVALAFRWWALAGAWFYFDDLAFLSRGQNSSLSWSYLTTPYAGHLMPAAFAMIWVLARTAVFSWTVWGGALLLMQAVAALGMLRLLLSMFGRRPAVLALLAVYLFTVFTVPAGVWFAAGINQLPMQVALVFGLHAHLDYLRTRRWQSLAQTLAWTLLAVAFYEKAVLLFGIYALVALCWFSSGNTPTRLRSLWDRYRVGILAQVVVASTYVAVYVVHALNFDTASATNPVLSRVAYNLVGVATATGVVGGPLDWQSLGVGSLAQPSQLVLVGAWLAVAGGVYYAYRTRTMSRRAWSLIGFTLVADVILLASARASLIGPDIALEYRYQTETAALLVLSLGLALFPLEGAIERNTLRPDVPRPYETTAVVTAVTGVVCLLAVVSSVRYVTNWQDHNQTEHYYRAVTSSLERAGGRVPLVDLGVPQDLLWAYGFPENTYSHVFRNLRARTTYPTFAVDSLFLFDDSGRLSSVQVPPVRTMVPALGCGYRPTTAGMTVPLNGPVLGGGWWFQMAYTSKRHVIAEIRAGSRRHEVDLPAGRHVAYFDTRGTFDSFQVIPHSNGTGLCLTDARLGIPEPGAPQ